MVLDVREVLCYLSYVLRVFLVFAAEEACEVSERLDDINICLHKVKVIERRAWLVQVRLVDEVPRGLPVTKCVLDIVSKSGALCEWVISFVHNHVRV